MRLACLTHSESLATLIFCVKIFLSICLYVSENRPVLLQMIEVYFHLKGDSIVQWNDNLLSCRYPIYDHDAWLSFSLSDYRPSRFTVICYDLNLCLHIAAAQANMLHQQTPIEYNSVFPIYLESLFSNKQDK